MKPNILFLIIDSLRYDKIFGKNRKNKTPNLDSLINKGTFFSQTISTSDQTGASLGSVFTGVFPIKSGKTQFNFNSNTLTFFDALKKEGYNRYSFVPDHDFFQTVTSNFEHNTVYDFTKKDKWLRLHGGLGKQIIDELKSKKMKEPWIYFIHLMDIRPPFQVPAEYDTNEFGENKYERLVSYIDTWIGKFFNEINLKNTLCLISSDHGEYIPVTDENIKEIPKVQNAITKGTKKLPFLEKVGMKMLINARFAAQTYRKEKLKRTLTPYEMRSLNSRSTLYLYDELIRVPLLFVGFGLKENVIINEMVRHVDVFPTILDMINQPQKESDVDGRSLTPLIEGKNFEEKPAYIEVGINLSQLIDKKNPDTTSKVIGIRTSDYKYFRFRNDSSKHVFLFDLKNDPLEEKNIAESHPEIIQKMENILAELKQNSNKNESSTLSDEEIKKAKKALLDLGYI